MPDLASLKRELAQAVEELRECRRERLAVETASGQRVTRDQDACEPATFPAVPASVVKELTSAADPPPTALHRLASSLVLLLEAELLVSLGEHSLPESTPWANLKTLLLRGCGPIENPAKLVAALRGSPPFGQRLATHVKDRVLGLNGSDPLTREAVEAANAQCACVFDYVMAVLDASLASPDSKKLNPDVKKQSDASDRASEAVAAKEREVAQLRRKVRAAEDSERAAERFAAENAPDAAAKRAVPQSESGAKMATAATETGHEKREERKLAQKQVLQYRLNETSLPGLQEAVLFSAEKYLSEARLTGDRALDIVGFSERREEEGAALERAEQVRDWFVQQGVDPSLLRLEAVPGGERGARLVELRLFDDLQRAAEGRRRMDKLIPTEAVRRHAEELTRSTAAAEVGLEAASGTKPAGLAVDTAPQVRSEEIDVDEDGRRRLRVIFSNPGLSAADTALDVGTSVLRLASNSAAWADVEVPLSFAIEPASCNAKFSKRAGTLTITLRAAS